MIQPGILEPYLDKDKELVTELLESIYPNRKYTKPFPIHDILSPFAGSYKWRKRDCAGLLHSFVELVTENHTPYKVFHKYDKEAIVFAKCKKIFGSILNAHNTILLATGMKRFEKLKPWSVVLASQGNIIKSTSGEHVCDNNEKLLPVIVDEGYNLFAYDLKLGWTTMHLMGDINYIYRAE